MPTKICIGECGLEKEISEFYKHSQMTHGVDSKCKECVKERAKIRHHLLMANPEFADQERERHKEKYHRLGYKEQQKEWDKDKPWKNTTIYKALSKKLGLIKGFEAHHWNYNDEFLEDVFVLKSSPHKILHTHLTLDLENRIFTTKEGEVLDTKKKHEDFIKSLKIEIQNE